ncbi:hypothetical protein QEZ54_17415 [Catellatospora sp. KI3]|uniref:hypothetical protein n=1 Tax=Catellatospora sp. KI3 TaxID=3041620 RepID=UPI0024823683|nr:hypothetical protein [Catellatospora sp. KI3]MDI1462757.1 hypothetical protein [Catellatospora sp. KI3]
MIQPSLPVDPSEGPLPRPAPVRGQHPVPPPPQPSRVRRWWLRGVAALTAFGVFGAIGSYYVPKLLDRLGEAIDPPPPPVAVTVVHAHTSSPNFVFPDGVDPAGVPQTALEALDKAEFVRWAAAHGGVAADEDEVRFVLRGRDTTLVHLESIRVKVLKRTPPRAGWFNTWLGCGAAVVPQHLRVDADGGTVRAQWLAGEGPVEAPAFTVSAADEEVVDVELKSTEDEIEWVLEVDYSSAAGEGTLTVDDGGRPFLLTTVGAARAWEYPEVGGSGLERRPERDPGAADGPRPPC